MSTVAQTATIIGVLAVVIGIQTVWITRALGGRFGRIEERLDRIEDVIRDHGERIARLEARA